MADADGLASRFGAAIDRLASSRPASLAAILILALVAFVPGFVAMAPVDGDEPGYAVAARAMLDTGDFSSVRLQTENDEWRPRGPYWVQAFVLSWAGEDTPIWLDRVPSIIAAVAAALLTWWMAIALATPRAALLAGLLVSGSGLLGLEGRLATADAMLLASTTLTAGALARLWRGQLEDHTGLAAILFWTGLAIGILVKGVVAPAMGLGAVLLLSIQSGDSEWWKRLRPSVGIVWLFLIVSPWLIAVALTFLQGASEGPSVEFLQRLGVPFRLLAPPGSYLLLLPLIAGPSVAFLCVAVPWLSREFRQPPILFALAWGAPLWLVAEVLPSKLPQTVLPAVPALALIAAVAVDAGTARIRGWVSWWFSLLLAVSPPLIAIVLPAAYFYFEGSLPIVATIAFVLTAFLGPLAWVWLRAGRPVASAALSALTAALIYAGFFGAYVPGLSGLRVGERLAALAGDTIKCFGPTFAAAGYPEESIVLALGPRTRIVDPWAAADFLNTSGCQVAAVDASQISSFRQRAEDLGVKVADRGHVTGVDLRKMRTVDVHLFTVDRSAQ